MSDRDENWERLLHAMHRRQEELGLGPTALAAKAGLAFQTVNDAMTGARRPQKRTRREIARALDWPPEVPERILHGEDPTIVLGSLPLKTDVEGQDDIDVAVALREGAGSYDTTELEAYARAAVAAEHERRREQLAGVVHDYAAKRGFTVNRSAIDTGPDLVLERDDEVWIVDLKTVTPTNERAQVRMAIGQLLDHQQENPDANLVLITDFPLSDEAPRRLLEQVGVSVAWPGDWTALDRNDERGNS